MSAATLATRTRGAHRWISIVFTATVAANFVAMAFGTPSPWVTYAPLPPLALLMFSGLYLFARPYAARRRAVVAAPPTVERP
ncbi:hypothetical protein [Roseisolibacter sp. H3M3-2]|uniref:hypothetical protein n=1 Tax=Roseisolibacter sp. H3M3-2 TaxID=3031323 RepID=UPI0023D9A97F|nr:hypothetical protein [Roseisolibacter sp. H3M3-2]MDF1502385.1 hypothetical protein [Roseisolibacter sp. H3M3-2]